MTVETSYGARVQLLWASPVHSVVLAAKVSAGKAREKGLDYYWAEYPERKREKIGEWLRDADSKFPSVLEHVTLSFYIDGCSRVCTHQLVRHRLASYTQESQRYSLAVSLSGVPLTEKYVKRYEGLGYPRERAALHAASAVLRRAAEELRLAAGDAVAGAGRAAVERVRQWLDLAGRLFVLPRRLVEEYESGRPAFLLEHASRLLGALSTYYWMVAGGVPEEDARYVLPQSVRTRLVMTVNLRELLHIVRLRSSPKAHWEIRELACALWREAASRVPELGVLRVDGCEG